MTKPARATIVPLMLMPMSEWDMKPCFDGTDPDAPVARHFAVGIYAQANETGYVQTWFKWPWACVPNNIIGLQDMERCGVLGHYLRYLDQEAARFEALAPTIEARRDS